MQKEEPVSSLWNRWKMHFKKARIFSVGRSARNCRSLLKLSGRVCVAWVCAKFFSPLLYEIPNAVKILKAHRAVPATYFLRRELTVLTRWNSCSALLHVRIDSRMSCSVELRGWVLGGLKAYQYSTCHFLLLFTLDSYLLTFTRFFSSSPELALILIAQAGILAV